MPRRGLQPDRLVEFAREDVSARGACYARRVRVLPQHLQKTIPHTCIQGYFIVNRPYLREQNAITQEPLCETFLIRAPLGKPFSFKGTLM